MPRTRWLSALLAGALSMTLAAAVPATASPHAAAGSHAAKRTVGYFTQWGIYGRQFFVRNLVENGSAARLTHINYAFGLLDEQGRCVSNDPWADYQRSFPATESVNGRADEPGQALAGNLNQLRQLKARFPKLRINISLGGWTGSAFFSNAALTPESRAAHVKSCIDLWLKGNLPQVGGDPHGGAGAAAGVFDGIDLDWEWPASEGNAGNVVRPEDRENFTALLREYRRQLGRGHDLTAFLPANPANIDRGYQVREIFRYLTFATTQGYDYHGAWDPITNQQSSLRTPAADPTTPKFSSQVVIDTLLSRGAPRDRLVMGVPFFSRGWTGVTNQNNGLFQPATGPAPGSLEAGFEDYRVLKTQLADFTVYRDAKAGHAWLFDGTTFWTFDDPTELRRKGRYVADRRLGGAMIWSLDGDTTTGELTAALHRGLTS